jgi:biotin transporter BioY
MSKYLYLDRLLIAISAVATVLAGYFLANALFLESRDGGGSQQVLFAIGSFTLAVALFGLHYQLSRHEPLWSITTGQLLREVVVGFTVLLIVMVASADVRLLLCVLPLVVPGILVWVLLAITVHWQRSHESRHEGSNG